jgi:flagellar hook-length control protein FliK
MMAEGIQFNAQTINGRATELSGQVSQSGDEQNTFLMLMQLMFPVPEKFITNDLEAEASSLPTSDESNINEPASVAGDQDDQTAQLALVLNWLGYAAGLGDDNQEGQLSGEAGSETEITLETLATLLAKSDKVVSQAELMATNAGKTNLPIKPLQSDNLPVDPATWVKQGPDLKMGDSPEIINTDVEIDSPLNLTTATQTSPNKQDLTNQLIAELVGKKILAQNTTHEGGTPLNGAQTTSLSNQVITASNAQVANLHPTPSVDSPKTYQLPTPMANQDWANQFNQQIVWLSQQQIKSAIIRLNPKEMGALEVNLKIDKNHAIIQMTTHHDSARDAIEQTLPKLRDMMHEQGIHLDDVNVQTRHQHDSKNQSQMSSATTLTHEDGFNDAQEESLNSESITVSKGLIDYFA